MSILKDGFYLKKYGRNNNFTPNWRLIFFNQDFTHITWDKNPEKTKITNKKSYKIEKLNLIEGKKTKNFKRFKKANEKLCFSIQLQDRSIDFEAFDEK